MTKKLFCLLIFLTTSVYPHAVKEIYLNVHITEAKVPCKIKIKGKYEVLNYKYKSKITSGNDDTLNIEVNARGIKIPEVGTYQNGFIIETENGFIYNGKEYYGDAVITTFEGKNILINRVSVEQYTMGVLPYEMSPTWYIEALKAQAVAARSYALFHYALNKDSGRPFDVDNTTKYQVYDGKGKANDNIRLAVEGTKNQIITFKRKVIPAYFHALCGGATDSTLNVFGVDIPYLRGIKCIYCKPKIEVWTNDIAYDKIKKSFDFSSSGKIAVKVAGTTSAKKISDILLSSSDSTKKIKAREFRSLLGVSLVPSLSFTMKPSATGIYVIGQGKGHGVGMCQWGAYGMAEKNIPYKKIISYYYKMTTLVDYTKQKEILPDIWKK